MIQIDALPAFNDNYIWLIKDTSRRLCAVVDPGDAAPVLAWLEANPQWRLTQILITHHHRDHVGGISALKAATGAEVFGPASEHIPERDVALNGGESISVLDLPVQVLPVPGHTLGHLAYYQAEHNLLFSGDTLFAGGCGRLFEGTPAQMLASLSTLAALPASTAVYCAHEYTLSNLRFAHAVEPENPEIAERLAHVTQQRENGQSTLPTSIALERATNPFLRSNSSAVIAAAQARTAQTTLSDTEVFAAIRAWKDSF